MTKFVRYGLYGLGIVTTSFVIVSSTKSDIGTITPWLLGINFTLALFSVNFTFFGHQLSKYKAIYHSVAPRQWINIAILLCVPFLPLASYLVFPEYFGTIALWCLPVLLFSAIDNALLTKRYLSPVQYIHSCLTEKAVARYLTGVTQEVTKELAQHRAYTENRNSNFKVPNHALSFQCTVLGLAPIDLWDNLTVVVKLSIENNDYPVFRKTSDAALKLLFSFYLYAGKCDDNSIADGIQDVARARFRSIVTSVADFDKEGIFLQTLSNQLCNFLLTEKALKSPLAKITTAVASDVIWIGTRMLAAQESTQPIKILNTIHYFTEMSIQALENLDKSSDTVSNALINIDKHNLTFYVYKIETLGKSAFNSDNSHFAYRCMETLSYLGCNAAKLQSQHTVVAVLESLVQLGRLGRKLGIGCFWTRCLIPVESHAEEFMGHILTWLVQNLSPDGKFFMKGYIEQAFSRLRGYKCAITPVVESNPRFWLKDIMENGEKVPHIEIQHGMFGYGGQVDYSDYTDLKDFVLYGIETEN